MVRFDVSDSYDADPFAQWARLHLGQVFTGSGTHLVPYRDRRAPRVTICKTQPPWCGGLQVSYFTRRQGFKNGTRRTMNLYCL